MNDTELKGLGQVEQFLTGTQEVFFKASSQRECYAWLARTLKRFDYHRLRKREKGTLFAYVLKVTGYSRQQLSRLVQQHRETRWIGRRRYQRHCFPRRYTRVDIVLLATTDLYHQTLSGPATKKLFERAYQVFADAAYERLAGISVAHIYNLRRSQTYLQRRRHFTKTQSTTIPIGERRKPNPQGQPGYLRIDTVHQGDLDKIKGVYSINVVDEMTQMEVVCAVEKISENYLLPALERIIDEFPFEIKGVHSDNGSEYINYRVAELLEKLLIEFTKSRARHSNDNALVESKNGSIVRKYMGYAHIAQRFAPQINAFYKKYLTPYINYHRPCFYAVSIVDKKGKEKKQYPYKAMMTPYEKLKSLKEAQHYLKPGITFDILDAISKKHTDLESAKLMYNARKKLFQKILGE